LKYHSENKNKKDTKGFLKRDRLILLNDIIRPKIKNQSLKNQV